jgi:hypothetical protein
MKKSRVIEIIQEEIQSALKERVFIDPSTDKGRDISLDAEGKPRFGTVASTAANAINAITKSYPELKTQANIVAAFLLSAKARKQDEIVIKGMDFEVKPHIVQALEEFDAAVAAQEDAYEDPKSRATLEKLANAAGTGFDLSSYMDFIQSGRPFTPSLGGPQTQRFAQKHLGLEEENLNEMAKIAGDLKSSIEKVINSNPDLSGLDLKKKIKADSSVQSALGDQTLHDNQLNKFIALTKGERELGQRGRKASTDKKETPKKSEPKKSEPKKSEPKKDEEDDATLAAATDSTAKELGSTTDDKKEIFNKGLKFIKKYKDNKAVIDAYLKKAKDEYKLSKTMLDDLKRTAGRDV